MNQYNSFDKRHIGPSPNEENQMLKTIGVNSLDELIDQTVPESIRLNAPLNIPLALSEHEYLQHIKSIADKNKIFRSFIGQGYYGTIVPSVISRNVFQNPGWYTQYTPYQAEIAQGRLESLLNFQTMVSDLTGMPIANASLLDEGTAAAEAMTMMEGVANKKRKSNPSHKFFVDKNVFKQTLDVVKSRALPLGIEVLVGDWKDFELMKDCFGILIQYPDAIGAINDYKSLVEKCKEENIYVSVASDLMALCLLTPPGEWGADVVLGNSQRFGVPLGYGGPHAAFFATTDEFKRLIPGRIIGVSVDVKGNSALRMALQTREQHIRREKATSNICTAQALLANMAAMYAVYHGQEGLKTIANEIHENTKILFQILSDYNINIVNNSFFDTITIDLNEKANAERLKSISEKYKINFYYNQHLVSISLDETVLEYDMNILKLVFEEYSLNNNDAHKNSLIGIPESLIRTTEFCTHAVFSAYHTESAMMRYIKNLENKDISLTHSMISLGSCTMKLNAATEMIPVSWSEFADLHPFAPIDQAEGYHILFKELSDYLCECTGFKACSLQPNSGAQGEYAGLLAIRAYHLSRNDARRNKVLIPSSAHGTNPASAVMAGMEVIVTECDDKGNIDLNDLYKKAEEHQNDLAALMVTYPSTHGVFEEAIIDICNKIHECGGLVYMDGANMNAQVGLTSPGKIGADVCHLNLHKTFAIPHGGGGPGMGPICVNEKLASFLPGHVYHLSSKVNAVSSAPFGSASILLISYAYIRMLGSKGLTDSTKFAILNANYIKARLEHKYEVLYTGTNGRAAHELIIDLRPYKAIGVSAEDVAKRLIDYGFHAPTLSFPVAGTIMIEPTESENKEELDRFCDAMLEIKNEIDEIARGEMDTVSNVLTNAPHTIEIVTSDIWEYGYTREKAAYPLPYLKKGNKFWASVSRVDNAYGDRNLVCTCTPIDVYREKI